VLDAGVVGARVATAERDGRARKQGNDAETNFQLTHPSILKALAIRDASSIAPSCAIHQDGETLRVPRKRSAGRWREKSENFRRFRAQSLPHALFTEMVCPMGIDRA
jgi:hypothetical protein